MHLRESLLRRHLWTFLTGTQSGAILPPLPPFARPLVPFLYPFL